MNFILFRCDAEERRETGNGVYELPGYGPLPYAGIQGFMTILDEIRAKNDLGNWLPQNLRDGNWIMDYIADRLIHNDKTKNLGNVVREKFEFLKLIPRFLIPSYFDLLVTDLYRRLLDRVWNCMDGFVAKGDEFVKALALGSVIHGGIIQSARIPGPKETISIAAGLPHFSVDYMRNWGRDTFISLRGSLILTGRIEEAKNIILGFASSVRHGLIPNLLTDKGLNARYNCRDAVWWWLQSIQDYCLHVERYDLLLEKVDRTYPTEVRVELHIIIFDCLRTHFKGLKFREWNAGKKIDEHMKDDGFNVGIGVDYETGFVYGGNADNCGTWMDKMGSSCDAGNKGQPSTPRDGSAVEIIGLCYSALKWLANLERRYFPYDKLIGHDREMTIKEWAHKIKSNFEMHYFIASKEDINKNDKRPDLINKTGIYKDTLNSGQPWTDYQLRPNFPIAMCVAPDLFNHERAWKALNIAKDKLLGPLGMATLDPDDWAYRGDYDNSNRSNDPTVADGANYHQGPEWVWPVGYFLRAYLKFGKLNKFGGNELEMTVKVILSEHYKEVMGSKWRGIPELTNSRGAFCRDSNPIQAWSMASLLEVLHDFN